MRVFVAFTKIFVFPEIKLKLPKVRFFFFVDKSLMELVALFLKICAFNVSWETGKRGIQKII